MPAEFALDTRVHDHFRSRFLEGERDITVHLPPGYDASGRQRYPVLYMQDGQNLSSANNDIGREWHLDETAHALMSEGAIRPMIIVGIAHAGKGRIDEYTPVRDWQHKMGGKAKLYGRMLVEEVKPLIDSTYRTEPDGRHTGLAGSSLGGLVSLYLGREYPTIFGRLGVLSPSVWWGRRYILRQVSRLDERLPLRIWLSIGTEEGKGALEDARALRDAILAKGWTLGDDFMYHEAQGAGHSEDAWSEIVGPALRFLFPEQRRKPREG